MAKRTPKLFYREFIQACKWLPEVKGPNFEIQHFTMTVQQIQFERATHMRDYWMVNGLRANWKYTRLVINNETWMSDTPMETNSNKNFIQHANGDVLIFGLGMGLIIQPLINDPDVKSITVIEKDPHLIKHFGPVLKRMDVGNKLTIAEGDAFYMTETFSQNPLYENKKIVKKIVKKFDSIYFDIWISICLDNYDEIKELERMYRKFLNRDNPNWFMGSWMKEYYKVKAREEAKHNAYLNFMRREDKRLEKNFITLS